MTRGRWSALVWGLAMALEIAAVVVIVVSLARSRGFLAPHILVAPGFATVGAVIAARRGNRIGWIFLAFGAFTALVGLLFALVAGGWVRETPLIERIGSALWPAGFMFFGAIFLLFPTGELPSPRWRPVAYLYFSSWSVTVLAPLFGFDDPMDSIGGVPIAVYVLAGVCTAPLFRLRRASAVERQQLRAVGYVIALTFVAIALGVVADAVLRYPPLVALMGAIIFFNAAAGIPIAITVAILRYRLYDIDVVIRKTLLYAVLAALLALLYVGGVFLLSSVLDPLTGDSDVTVAATTLAVAALFRPVRARVRDIMDRRFYRARYDARREIDAFTARLRHEVELTAVRKDIEMVVAGTMHPRHAAVWLKTDVSL